MDERLEVVLATLWSLSGAIAILRWKFTEREVSLLDVVIGLFLGAIFGALIPVVQLLHAIKIKGGQHGAE